MCYENGMTVDDLLVYMMEEDYYILVINAGNIDKDFEWVKKQSENFDVKINNISSYVGQLAIQGQKQKKSFQRL